MPQISAPRPNILIVLADDMGFSDLGCYGGEIHTPNIDRLAAEGLRFSDYHTSPLCSPTRSMLMSGTDCHLAGLGVMHENASKSSEYRNRPGFEGYMNKDVVALPELLQEGGYSTIMSGKWHLGYKRGHIPCDRGFEKSFSMLCGCQNHFGWTPDWKAIGLGGNARVAAHNEPIYVFGEKRWQPTPNTTDDPNGYYSSDFFADTLIGFLKEKASDTTMDEDKPFFAYLPFSAPHQPIQCLKADRDKYKGVYDDGPAMLREKRLKKLGEMGFIDPDVTPHPVLARNKEWEKMTLEEQKISARNYECYAGMVEALDRATGRVIDYLRETGELDRTIVMVLSDNGPEGGGGGGAGGGANGTHELSDILGDNIPTNIKEYYDNSYENQGAYNSFPRPGARWAQASSAPNRMFKHLPTEGGIRVPMVLRYPPFTEKHRAGSISHAFATVMDIMPTILTLAGITHPNANPATPTTKAPWKQYSVYPMRGKDWTPYLYEGRKAEASEDFTKEELKEQTQRLVGRKKLFITPGEDQAIWGGSSMPVGWEMHSKAGVRKGKWKILNVTKNYWGTGNWQLYDLEVDQGEVYDLAKERPDKLKEMIAHWEQYQKETGAYLRREHPEMPPAIEESDFSARPGQAAWMRVPMGDTLGYGDL